MILIITLSGDSCSRGRGLADQYFSGDVMSSLEEVSNPYHHIKTVRIIGDTAYIDKSSWRNSETRFTNHVLIPFATRILRNSLQLPVTWDKMWHMSPSNAHQSDGYYRLCFCIGHKNHWIGQKKQLFNSPNFRLRRLAVYVANGCRNGTLFCLSCQKGLRLERIPTVWSRQRSAYIQGHVV